MSTYTDIGVEKHGHVGLIEIRRPPLNFFNVALINQIADALEEFDKDVEIRASVLAAQGKAFCAGADFSDPDRQKQEEQSKSDPASNLPINHLYVQAVRIFRARKPFVAAVHGAAIGGGFGLAVAADFRVTCPEARFAANFTKLGFHPGFGLTATLPELVGRNNAELIFYTSRRINGEDATKMGLANVCVPQDYQLRFRLRWEKGLHQSAEQQASVDAKVIAGIVEIDAILFTGQDLNGRRPQRSAVSLDEG